jgi:hypothetical protein
VIAEGNAQWSVPNHTGTPGPGKNWHGEELESLVEAALGISLGKMVFTKVFGQLLLPSGKK